MIQKLTLEQIREFWEKQASEHGESRAASWSDSYVMEMEIREILNYLQDGDRVLDAGCANGYSTVQFASQKAVHITGVDYVEQMIHHAKERVKRVQEVLAGSIEFRVADITKLEDHPNTYDKVIVIRVIINLGEWETQLNGINECVRVLKPGGLLLLSEATLQGWNQMNRFRREWNLPDIPMPVFNHYLDQERVIAELASQAQLVQLSNFSSTYFVGTRVLKPLLIQALGLPIDVANPQMEWNRFFSHLPAWGDYGTQKLFIFRKK
jgi:ubiquinone/menaquinone biosynthesis C-methylase UbiE